MVKGDCIYLEWDGECDMAYDLDNDEIETLTVGKELQCTKEYDLCPYYKGA